ncbi:MAG: hypothetical protein JXA90_08255, partial [Planctomycetes bacterium]|nr:hypothetical protein [Planctomycetota bacterium]
SQNLASRICHNQRQSLHLKWPVKQEVWARFVRSFPVNPDLESLRRSVAAALRRLREGRRWKAGKDREHLAKRIALGHLPSSGTLADYDAIIGRVLENDSALVYVYSWRETAYPTVSAEVDGKSWLVIFGLDAIMETAFPPTAPGRYLADKRFVLLGRLSEILE